MAAVVSLPDWQYQAIRHAGQDGLKSEAIAKNEQLPGSRRYVSIRPQLAEPTIGKSAGKPRLGMFGTDDTKEPTIGKSVGKPRLIGP
jgi:hypothetical protein